MTSQELGSLKSDVPFGKLSDQLMIARARAAYQTLVAKVGRDMATFRSMNPTASLGALTDSYVHHGQSLYVPLRNMQRTDNAISQEAIATGISLSTDYSTNQTNQAWISIVLPSKMPDDVPTAASSLSLSGTGLGLASAGSVSRFSVLFVTLVVISDVLGYSHILREALSLLPGKV
jgi:hypothetical protein